MILYSIQNKIVSFLERTEYVRGMFSSFEPIFSASRSHYYKTSA